MQRSQLREKKKASAVSRARADGKKKRKEKNGAVHVAFVPSMKKKEDATDPRLLPVSRKKDTPASLQISIKNKKRKIDLYLISGPGDKKKSRKVNHPLSPEGRTSRAIVHVTAR